MYCLYLTLLTFLATNFISCNSNHDSSKDITNIAKSYGIIYGGFAITKQAQENFFSEATKLLGQVKYNKDAVVDTKKIKLLLDSARSASETRITMINFAEEADNEIAYKSKALKFVKLLDTLYKNEFTQFINILGSKTENRFEKCQTLLWLRLLDMKKAMTDCSEAGDAFREKYDIKIID